MTALDTIFGAWFSIVTYDLHLALMTAIVIFEFLYIFISRWDLV
jgi:hypothetical protein